jgi:hypothetical protein
MTVPVAAAAPATARKFRPSFFFWMTLAMAFFVFGGFGIHSAIPALQGNFPPAPPVVHLHAVVMQLIASRAGMDAGRDPGTDGLYLGLLAAIGFATLFTLAIRNTRRPEIHKRMILFAMLPVLPPGVNRFWSNVLGLDDPIPTFWLYLTLWSMAVAILVQERRATGRISGYSWFGAGWIFVEGAVHEAVVGSPAFSQIAGGILGLVHYR